MTYAIGIDIGSTSAKAAVFSSEKKLLDHFILPTGWSSVDTAEKILDRLEKSGYHPDQSFIIATGYGRVSVPYADKTLTEISCHAKGAVYLFESKDLTVIDIGGQDTKVIRVENGCVSDFTMNDKCSAGTGRFLEVMASTLGLRPEELCLLAKEGSGVSISSLCTVFAESEVIGLIGQGEKKENIAFAVVDSIVKKVSSQARRINDSGGKICLTGGFSNVAYVKDALGNQLHTAIQTHELGQFAGAVGAALYGLETL